MSQKLDLVKIKKALKDFSVERDWEKFHNPKNLSMALSVEVSELVEIFQWVNDGGENIAIKERNKICLLYTSPSPRDGLLSRMPSSA